MHAADMLATLRATRASLTTTGRPTARSALAEMALRRAQRAAEAGDDAAFNAAIEDARHYDRILGAHPLVKRLADA